MEEKLLPPGFRFHPTDEELITYYLTGKVTEIGFVTEAIADVDLNKCDPWDLPGKASMGEKEWYFFSIKDRKYPTGLRINRATESGYWKTTGKDKEIFHRRVLVGMKKTLVFYKGRAPTGEKTNWVMHEYKLIHTKLPYSAITKEEWVVCRVFKKSCSGKIIKPQPSPLQASLDYYSSCNNFTSLNASNLNDFVSASSTIGSQKPLQLPNYNGEWIQGLLGAGIVPEMMKASLPAIHNIVQPHQAQAEAMQAAAMSDVASLGSCVAQGDNNLDGVSTQEILWRDY
ncbi:NAC domain-containing protein 79-like [Zingiber officinale]|uniref:NAC domain-containing protein n=1 Tax=Zingiber officinale TaxID=94328 RepID=A0A8J5FUG2_ZINOF|nr:NAC domain-containing protein 79-like [Zingiber officinale]KAG6485846.1 hypothetical protein ZIOFF_054411 [Zingiber officinale]